MSKKSKSAQPNPKEPKAAPTTAEMRALIERERQERIMECQRMIQIALETTRCGLDVKMIVTERGNVPQVDIIAND